MMAAPIQPPATQVRYPWRTTARTAVAAAVGALPLVAIIAPQLGPLATTGAGAAFVGACAAVTRVLAEPAVNTWIHRYAAWLAPQPPDGPPPVA